MVEWRSWRGLALHPMRPRQGRPVAAQRPRRVRALRARRASTGRRRDASTPPALEPWGGGREDPRGHPMRQVGKRRGDRRRDGDRHPKGRQPDRERLPQRGRGAEATAVGMVQMLPLQASPPRGQDQK